MAEIKIGVSSHILVLQTLSHSAFLLSPEDTRLGEILYLQRTYSTKRQEQLVSSKFAYHLESQTTTLILVWSQKHATVAVIA